MAETIIKVSPEEGNTITVGLNKKDEEITIKVVKKEKEIKKEE
jgi:hypothetical protein